MNILFQFLLVVTSIFLILIILVQKGKGGGLAGAFGGMGGQSAFGSKAGDTFTKITIGVVAIWLILCISAVGLLPKSGGRVTGAASPNNTTQQTSTSEPGQSDPDAQKPAEPSKP